MKRFLTIIFFIILTIVGLGLVFNKQLLNSIVELQSYREIKTLSKEEIRQNKSKKVSFNFEEAKGIDLSSMLKMKFNKEQILSIGEIVIPEINIKLPILKGVSEKSLATGAGTMRENQIMGKDNYPLASHNMNQPGILFSSLINIKKGDIIYITDLSYVYIYKTYNKEYINPNKISVIENHGKNEITLITCNNDGSERLYVNGYFVKKEPVNSKLERMFE